MFTNITLVLYNELSFITHRLYYERKDNAD